MVTTTLTNGAVTADNKSNTKVATMVFGHDVSMIHHRAIDSKVYDVAEIWYGLTKGNSVWITYIKAGDWDDLAYIKTGVYILMEGKDDTEISDATFEGEILIFNGNGSYFRITYESLVAILNAMSPDDFVRKCVLPSKDPIGDCAISA